MIKDKSNDRNVGRYMRVDEDNIWEFVVNFQVLVMTVAPVGVLKSSVFNCQDKVANFYGRIGVKRLVVVVWAYALLCVL